MRIECTETVDVTFNADVTIEDVLSMFAERINSGPNFRTVGTLLDWITKMLDQIPPEIIAAFPDPAYNELNSRMVSLTNKFRDARALSVKSAEQAKP